MEVQSENSSFCKQITGFTYIYEILLMETWLKLKLFIQSQFPRHDGNIKYFRQARLAAQFKKFSNFHEIYSRIKIYPADLLHRKPKNRPWVLE